MVSTAVTTGLALGGSSSIGIFFELPDDSKTVQTLFKTYKRSAIVSTCVSLSIGVFCGPVAGVISEMITYPTCLLKTAKLKRKAVQVKNANQSVEDSSYLVDNNFNFSHFRSAIS